MPRPAMACALLLCCGTARAEILPTLPLRELAIRADAVVLAEPIEPNRPGRFRVRERLKGIEPRAGAEIEVEAFDACVRPKEEPEWGRVDAVLLFLRTESGRYSLVESGVRLYTRERMVWWPVQEKNPGPYHMARDPDVTWEAAILRVRDDAGEVARLLAARGLADAGRRGRALLGWVELHRSEFGDGREAAWVRLSPSVRNLSGDVPASADLDARGWGELQMLPFAWVLADRIPADCWRAVNLYAELHEGAILPSSAGAFAGRDGRGLLLTVARDTRQLDGNRARALRLLGDRQIYATTAPNEREREDLLDGLLPLLADRAPTCRALAAQALRPLCGKAERTPAQVQAALGTAYKAEQPGSVRNALAEALHEIANATQWQEWTGRAPGRLALLRDLGKRDDLLFFWLTLQMDPPLPVIEAPTLVLERLDAKGAVAEKQAQPLPASAPPAWANGWTGGPLHVQFAHGELKPGTWRLRVTGFAGKDKVPWESEPRTVQVVLPNAPAPRPGVPVWDTLVRRVTGTPEPQAAMTPEMRAARKVILDGEGF